MIIGRSSRENRYYLPDFIKFLPASWGWFEAGFMDPQIQTLGWEEALGPNVRTQGPMRGLCNQRQLWSATKAEEYLGPLAAGDQ